MAELFNTFFAPVFTTENTNNLPDINNIFSQPSIYIDGCLIQVNAMQQHFRIALIALQNNAWVIALSSAHLPLTFGSDQRLDYCG